MWIYRLFLLTDIVALAIVLGFFAIGIGDGSVSSFNILLWLGLLTVLVAISFSGYRLNKAGNRKAASALLALVAIPSLIGALFSLSIIIVQPRWN